MFQNIDILIPIYFKFIQPPLLTDYYWIKIFYLILEKRNKYVKNSTLIFKGTRDGLNAQYFWKAVNNKENLLMIFQSKSEYIFGAYSPCKWLLDQGDVADPTYASFLFSQTHNLVYPQKSSARAIYCSSNYGPTFGEGSDIWICGDFTDSSSRIGYTFQFHQYQNGKNNPHLFGQIQPQIKECEIYEI
ncbi:unnamed protein product [Paramecium octaurelia]|uniref:TLDc domain-containing protein n=1 Tax=Paramecium octaurelia TaxID=43137 RepID=A0A8S1U279_PAROT|nr:unnamed protein product [Paramecium octaurelia]